MNQSGITQNKLLILLIARSMGWMGIHDFVLGRNQEGWAKLVLFFGGIFTSIIGAGVILLVDAGETGLLIAAVGMIAMVAVWFWVFVDMIRIALDPSINNWR